MVGMVEQSSARLHARIEELEAENAALKAGTADGPRESVADPALETRPKRRWPWTLLATILIVVGAILAPIAVLGSWAAATLTDTDRFVAVYAPLARDADVQEFVSAEVVAAITEQVDIPAITSEVFDGIIELGTGPMATRAIEALKGPAAAGVQGLLASQVEQFVASDAFSMVWAQALRLSHSQLVSAINGDEDALVSLSGTGEIGIQLAPVIEEVRTVLLEQGLTFATQIPAIDRTIVVGQSDALPTIQLGYHIVVDAGSWLPIISFGLLVVGVLVARRRSIALVLAAVALAAAMALTLAVVAAARIGFLAATGGLLPTGVAGVLFGSVTGGMRDTAVAVLVIAVVTAFVAWLAGPFHTPRRLRAAARSAANAMRSAAETRGVTTGRVGSWIGRHIALLRIAVAIAAAAVVLFVRPLSPAVTLWTLVLAALAIGVLEVVQRPVAVIDVDTATGSPAVDAEPEEHAVVDEPESTDTLASR